MTAGFSSDAVRRIIAAVRTVEGLPADLIAGAGGKFPRSIDLDFIKLDSLTLDGGRYPAGMFRFDESGGVERVCDVWAVEANGDTPELDTYYPARRGPERDGLPVYRFVVNATDPPEFTLTLSDGTTTASGVKNVTLDGGLAITGVDGDTATVAMQLTLTDGTLTLSSVKSVFVGEGLSLTGSGSSGSLALQQTPVWSIDGTSGPLALQTGVLFIDGTTICLDPSATGCYAAKVNSLGMSASTGVAPGVGTCNLFAVDVGTFVNLLAEQFAFNLGAFDIPAGEWVVLHRDKFGAWLAHPANSVLTLGGASGVMTVSSPLVVVGQDLGSV